MIITKVFCLVEYVAILEILFHFFGHTLIDAESALFQRVGRVIYRIVGHVLGIIGTITTHSIYFI